MTRRVICYNAAHDGRRSLNPMHGTIPLLPLRLDGVVYEIGGLRLVDGITAVIGAGTRTGILGPNGAGKSPPPRPGHGPLAPTTGRLEDAGAAGPGAGRARP